MKKTRVAWAFLLCFCLALNVFFHQTPNRSIIYAADAYDNDILWIAVYQYNGATWNLVKNFTSSGGTTRVHDSWPLNFTVCVRFNATLASSSEEAITCTTVYMNITGIWNNAELNNTYCDLSGDFYILYEQAYWHDSGKPQAGVTYNCSFNYDGYY